VTEFVGDEALKLGADLFEGSGAALGSREDEGSLDRGY
jgi:hypothetical protein